MQSIVSHSWPEVCFYALQRRKDAVTAFAACESKSNLITIVSLSLSSNKLGNNFNCDSNLLMAMSSLLISNKKYYLWIGLLLIITFGVVRSQKCEFQVHYLNKKDFLLTIWHMLFFEKKVNSFIKIRERGQSLNRSFRIHKIGTSKTDFKFTTEQKKRLNTLYSNYYTLQ